MKVDKRRHYVLVIDTETANTIVDEKNRLDMSSSLVYDCGWAVVDTKGNIYETASYVNSDIFVHERELMLTACYADKIPRYIEEIQDGKRVMLNTYGIRQAMLNTIDRWGIEEIVAHNARFDCTVLNCTRRYVTSSKYRYWFPFNSVTVWDTMLMAQDVICKMPTYKAFCTKHGFTLKNGAPRKTAEILYRFITGNVDFEESHTGLEDVLIEAQIMFYCFRQHKPMRKVLWEKKEFPPQTDFQRQILVSLKEVPTLWREQNLTMREKVLLDKL